MGLIFTYALTYGGAVTSLFNPFYGLLIYICFSIIKPESLWHWSVPVGNYSRIIAIALLAGWVINGCGGFRFGRAKWPAAFLVGFWCTSAFSAAFCANTEVGMAFLESMAKIVLPVIVGLTLIKSVKQLKQLAWTISLCTGYLVYDFNSAYFSGYNKLEIGSFGGMDNNSTTIGLVTVLGLTFFLGLSVKGWKKWLLFACAALNVHAVLFSFSRGGMVGMCVVAITTFLIIPKSFKNMSLVALGATAGLMLAGQEVLQEFASSFADGDQLDYSAESRLDLWKACVQIALGSPLFGIGPDHFPLVAHTFGFTPNKEAHSLWFQQLAETGIIGVAFLLMYYCTTAYQLLLLRRFQQLTHIADPFMVNLPAMIITSLAGFMVAAQFVSLEGLEVPYYVTMLGAGGIKVAASQAYRNKLESEESPQFSTPAPGLELEYSK